MDKQQQAKMAKVVYKITVTKTIKVEVTKAEADKKTACNCCSQCKR